MKCSLLSSVKSCVIIACVLIGLSAASCKKTTQADEIKVIPFSHNTHVQNYNIKDCGTCHKYDANGTFQGLPSVGECTACHRGNGDLFSDDRKANPRKKTMFDSWTDKDKPWVSRVENSRLFYFSHKVKMTTNLTESTTKLKCDMCHSDKAVSTGRARLKGEKLMEECIYCHTAYKLDNTCTICHDSSL
ncbi:MAG TPA: cytochrome c3 family protein [Spirochaetota bacterium]|nr:cytochrome c3 family protein [Spirochaetota bacterium]